MEENKDMGSCRCPYLVRHGQYEKKTKSIIFTNQCAFKIKSSTASVSKIKKTSPKNPNKDGTLCKKYPLKENEDYFSCEIFRKSFLEEKRDAHPTTDLDFGMKGTSSSLLDLEIL